GRAHRNRKELIALSKKLMQEREAAATKAREIAEKAKNEERALSAEEIGLVTDFVNEIKALDNQIKASMDAQSLLDSIQSMPEVEKKERDGSDISLGQHFVKGAFGELNRLKGGRGMNIVVPEFKAATDTHLTTTTGAG